MNLRQCAAALVGVLLFSGTAPACTLVLSEHRTGKLLHRVQLDADARVLRVAFVHSVLNTPVEDFYRFDFTADGWRAFLVEERWSGEGYGLAYAAGPGERLVRDGDGWRLLLNRRVEPLVIRPLPAQRMRLLIDGRPPLLLGSLSTRAIAFEIETCPRDMKNAGL